MTKSLLALCAILNLILASEAFAVDGLGRLFTTPEERASLDYLRQTTKVEALNTDPATTTQLATPAPPVVPESISVQGYVKRSDGKKGTVWINHKPMQESSSNSDVEVGKLTKDGNQIPLKLPANGKNFNLKAGQVYSTENGSIGETNTLSKVTNKNKDVEPVVQTPSAVGQDNSSSR